MVSLIEWIKQNFTITTTYNPSLPEIERLKALLNTEEGKKEEFDLKTESDILLKQYQDEKITLAEFKINYAILLKIEIPEIDEDTVDFMIDTALEQIKTVNTTMQNNNPDKTETNSQAENSNKLEAGESDLDRKKEFNFDAEKKSLVQEHLKNETFDEALFKENFLQLLEKRGTTLDDNLKNKIAEVEIANFKKNKKNAGEYARLNKENEALYAKAMETSQAIYKQNAELQKLSVKNAATYNAPTSKQTAKKTKSTLPAKRLIVNESQQKKPANLGEAFKNFGDDMDKQLASLQPNNANLQNSVSKLQSNENLEKSLNKFYSKRSKSLTSGCFCGLFKTSNLKEKDLKNPQAIVDHAKKGRFFGFFDNRTCSILKEMKVLDSKGELLENNSFGLKANKK
jgi:hypothetical protein